MLTKRLSGLTTRQQGVSNRAEMSQNPFASPKVGEFFTGSPLRQQKLDLLAHMAPYGGILLLVGEEGSGKTTFLQQLASQVADKCRLCVVQGRLLQDRRQLLDKMLECFVLHGEVPFKFSLDEQSSFNNDRFRLLFEHLGMLRQHGLAPVLIIDDADYLRDEIYTLLERLFDNAGTDLLTLILSGGGELQKSMQSPVMKPLSSHIAHTFELVPYSEQELTDYIHWYLSQSGVQDTRSFKPATFKFLHVASRGLPARINDLARVVWENDRGQAVAGNGQPRSATAGVLLTRVRYAIPVIVLSVIGMLYYPEIQRYLFTTENTEVVVLPAPADAPATAARQQQSIVEQPSVTASVATTQVADTSAPELDSDSEQAMPVEAATDDLISSPQPQFTAVQQQPAPTTPVQHAIRREVQDAGDNRPVPPSLSSAVETLPPAHTNVAMTAGQQTINPASPSEENEQAPSPQAGVLHGSESLASLSPQAATMGDAVVEKRQGGKQATEKLTDKDAVWWLAQDGRQFAIQLLVMEAPAVSRFIEKYNLRQQAAIFPLWRDEQELQAVAIGPFVSREQAMAEVSRMSAQLAGVKPWVRSVDSIHQAIKHYQQFAPTAFGLLLGKHEQRLLTATGEQYAVQLLAMEPLAATRFVEQHQLRERVSFFRTRQGERELLAVILGPYATREEATIQGRNLQQQVAGIKPWVRSIQSVQQSIRDRQGSTPPQQP